MCEPDFRCIDSDDKSVHKRLESCDPFMSGSPPFGRSLPDLLIAWIFVRFLNTWGSTLLDTLPPSSCTHLWTMLPLFLITPGPRRALLDEKNGGQLSVLHVSKRGIFRLGFQNLGETLLGVLLLHDRRENVPLYWGCTGVYWACWACSRVRCGPKIVLPI